MDQDGFDKQMSMTNKKEKIFNVRKLHYKQFDNEKCTPSLKLDLKPTYTPFHIKEHTEEPFSSTFLFYSKDKIRKKGGEYNYQVAIISSPLYKELTKKFNSVKEEYSKEKQKRLEVKTRFIFQELREREEELNKCKVEKERIDAERIKIIQRRDELRSKIEEIREKNEILKNEQMQRRIQLSYSGEEYRIMNMEYLRNMIIGMKYQNGMEIDLDNMTYEEMLELEEKMGSVSKGLTEEQISKLPKRVHKEGEHDELCSVCYYNAKEGEEITVLPCKHCFHTDCIKEWLVKEKVCPMCKQEILTRIQSSKKLIIPPKEVTSQEQISKSFIEQHNFDSEEEESEEKQETFNEEQKAESELLAMSGQ